MLHHPTGTSPRRRRADWIVLAVRPAPVDGLCELKAVSRELGIKVHRIGDALAPRRAHAAVIDGERVGAAL